MNIHKAGTTIRIIEHINEMHLHYSLPSWFSSTYQQLSASSFICMLFVRCWINFSSFLSLSFFFTHLSPNDGRRLHVFSNVELAWKLRNHSNEYKMLSMFFFSFFANHSPPSVYFIFFLIFYVQLIC